MADLGGRPIKWTPDINEKIIAFFSSEPFKEKEITTTDKKGNEYTRYETVAEELPTFERFASSIDVNCDTLVAWAKYDEDDSAVENENAKKGIIDDSFRHRCPGFSAAYTRAKQLQKDFVLANAIQGRYNPQFSIFFAKNNLGMKDKSDLDLSSTDGSMSPVANLTDEQLQALVDKANGQ